MIMACGEVECLIKFLRICGDNVINGQTKFTVTPDILKEINEVTRTIKDDFYISPLTNKNLMKKYSSNDDLMFLYNFVKKTPKLKISNTVSSHKFAVSLSDFNNLKYLELYKFNVKYIKDIQLLRENLEMVVCVRCLDKVSDLLLSSDTNAYISSIPPIWNKLRHAVLARNSLVSLDESFIHTPWLQYLDISYNNLGDIRLLACLRNLTHLNASYNRLTEIPKFAMFKLKVLILNNNYITHVTGVSTLGDLQECNLSDNCIAEHANLLPFAELQWLHSLDIQRNPLAHHPMHRSLTCGYLHENVANKHFLLDNRPFTNAEREFIRYSSRGYNISSVGKENTVESNEISGQDLSEIVKKVQKKDREAVISDSSIVWDDSNRSESAESSVIITKDEEHDDKEIIIYKEKMKALREERGPDYWLRTKPALNSETILGIGNSNSKHGVILQDAEKYIFTEESSNIISVNEGTSSSMAKEIDENRTNNCNTETVCENLPDNEKDCDILSVNYGTDGNVSSDEGERSDIQCTDITSEENLWLIERIKDNNDKDKLFLILTDCELEEREPVKLSVITRWSIDCIERYIKISNEPFTLRLIFDVIKRNNRQRTYIMEYADAQILMKRIDAELESRPLNQILQLRCMRCDALFCEELPKRLPNEEVPIYACTTCHSTAVLLEDVSIPQNEKLRNNNDTNLPSKSAVTDEAKGSNVTQSPSLSSIGSATSLDQNPDGGSNDVSRTSYQESDIEVISNPSESSIEILHREPNRLNENKSVLQRLSERLSISDMSTCDLSSVSAAVSQMLTESSSSGSMTDSSCTTIESNYPNRGPHRISQSTVDETLLEESSSIETSPQQRYTDEGSITLPEIAETPNFDKKNKNEAVGGGITNYFTGVISLMLPLNPVRNDQDKVLSTPFEYSYTDFAKVDHRIQLYFWDQITVHNEEISAFVRVNAIVKIGCTNQPFPGLVFFTSKKMYMVKITNKEIDENPNVWLQKNESVVTERIKLIHPILRKQGFCVNTEDRLATGENVRYVMLLYDERRTDNFLSFIRDRGIMHVQTFDDTVETRDLIPVSEICGDIRNLTVTDAIIIRHDDGGHEIHNFVAFVVTDEDFLIVKIDDLWSPSNEARTPAILAQERITDLLNLEQSKDGISLEFENESEGGMEKSWYVSTVSYETTACIIDAIREPWKKYFDVQLPTSQAIQ